MGVYLDGWVLDGRIYTRCQEVIFSAACVGEQECAVDIYSMMEVR